MKNGTKLVAGLVCATVLALSTLAYADGGYKGKSGENELLMKIKMIMLHKSDLGLTDEQTDKLADIKHAVMKDVIKMEADIDIIAVDVKTLLMKDTVDVAKIQPLVEKKYQIKKDKAMRCIQALADAKKVLTPEQIKQLKDICNEQWKARCGYGHGKHEKHMSPKGGK
jgi:Spy/CpxP family protein refolding chaperone